MEKESWESHRFTTAVQDYKYIRNVDLYILFNLSKRRGEVIEGGRATKSVDWTAKLRLRLKKDRKKAWKQLQIRQVVGTFCRHIYTIWATILLRRIQVRHSIRAFLSPIGEDNQWSNKLLAPTSSWATQPCLLLARIKLMFCTHFRLLP